MPTSSGAPPIRPENWQQTLPGRYYYDESIYERESRQVWEAMWVCIGRSDEAATAGQFFTRDVGHENVLVIRGRDGVLRAFLNVCRHRGARICTESCGQAKNSIQCKYHAWTYALDGRIIGAPNLAKDMDLKAASLDLIPVALEEWWGYVWVNVSGDAGALREQIGPVLNRRFDDLDKLKRYGIDDLRVGKRIEYDVAANWKLGVENFMECYHCAPMHPELCRLLPDFKNGTSYQQRPGHGTEYATGVNAFTLSGDGSYSRLPGLTEEDDRLYYGFVLPPNVFVNLLPDHVIIHVEHPRGPERTTVVCEWLFPANVIEEEGFDPTEVVDVFDLVNRQDWEVCELTQLGMKSRAYEQGGFYVNNEEHIADFRDMILERLGEVAPYGSEL